MLIFFTKAPRIGFGKTRLSAILPAERCLHLARLLLSDTFKVARHFEVVVYYDGKPADLEFLFSAYHSGGETGHLPAHTSAPRETSDCGHGRERVSERVSGRVSGRVSEDVPERVSGRVAEDVPEHVPDHVSAHVSAGEHLSGSASVPGCVPACLHAFVPERVPSCDSGCQPTQRPQLYPQLGATLGERMQHALFQQLSHHRNVILIGSDIVGLTPKLIDRAYKALETHDIVITPTLDGGYGLIGMRKPCDVFSGMRFSQDDVARNTVKCARERGYSITMEGTLLDVDTFDDALRAETGTRDVRCIGAGEYNSNFLIERPWSTVHQERDNAPNSVPLALSPAPWLGAIEAPFVLRVNRASQINLGHKQIRYEFNALRFLEPSGVTPRVYSCTEQGKYIPFGMLTMEYLPGRPLQYERDLALAARLLARVHALDATDAPLLRPQYPQRALLEECKRMWNVYECFALHDAAGRGADYCDVASFEATSGDASDSAILNRDAVCCDASDRNASDRNASDRNASAHNAATCNASDSDTAHRDASCSAPASCYTGSHHSNSCTAERLALIQSCMKIAAHNAIDTPCARPCVINTELNSGNFIINDEAPRAFSCIIDWEKPVIADCEQDIAHFLVPTTTNWKTDTILSAAEIRAFLDEYARFRAVDTQLLRTYMQLNVLRGITWCAMAFVQYSHGEGARNVDTWKKIQEFLSIEYLTALHDRFFGASCAF